MRVAPFTGAWIETPVYEILYRNVQVAPFTGAWIETVAIPVTLSSVYRRTLHGCVD